MPQVGEVLGDKYRLIRQIGAGGMGAVFEARHEKIGKRLAVKCLLPEFARDSNIVSRFSREAEAAAAIGHPAIIDIHDIGTAPDGSLFLVMEFMEGESLGNLLERTGVVPAPFAAYVLCQVLSALNAAHAKGIVHRDLKPDNIFLVNKGQRLPEVKLLDFGISKVVDRNNPDARLTQTGALMGTPYYMSPEQARGAKDIDHLADVYAMGVILYESVTGRRPFEGDTYLALVHEIVNSFPPPPRSLRPELPLAFEQVIVTAMAKDKNARYQCAAMMLDALLPFVEEHAVGQITLGRLSDPSGTDLTHQRGPDSSPSFPTGTPPTRIQPPTRMAWQATTATEQRTKRTGLVVGLGLGGVLVLVGGVVAIVLASGLLETSTPPPPPRVLAAPVVEPPTPPAPPPVQEVSLTLTGVPSGARILVDGNAVDGPVVRRPRSEENHQVRVEADGYQPWSRSVSFTQDASLVVEMPPMVETTATQDGATEDNADEPPDVREPSRRERREHRARERGRVRPRDVFGSSFE